jgi:hypothetical protein
MIMTNNTLVTVWVCEWGAGWLSPYSLQFRQLHNRGSVSAEGSTPPYCLRIDSWADPTHVQFGPIQHHVQFGPIQHHVQFGSIQHHVQFGSIQHHAQFGPIQHHVQFGSIQHHVQFGPIQHHVQCENEQSHFYSATIYYVWKFASTPHTYTSDPAFADYERELSVRG